MRLPLAKVLAPTTPYLRKTQRHYIMGQVVVHKRYYVPVVKVRDILVPEPKIVYYSYLTAFYCHRLPSRSCIGLLHRGY